MNEIRQQLEAVRDEQIRLRKLLEAAIIEDRREREEIRREFTRPRGT